jgi:hypothetical protein
MSTAADPTNTPSQCIITDSWHDSVVVIRCVGDLDMLTVPALERQIDTALAKRPTAMIVDFTSLDFLASVGMGLLVAYGPATSRPMRMIGLADLMDLYPTLEQAFANVVR